MGLRLSLYTVYQVARITAPTVLEAMVGAGSRDEHDRRLREFACHDAAVPSPSLRMVAKTELFRIPGFGRAMRAAEFVEVDRGDRARAVDSLKRAAATLGSGVSVWIAPEGHRSRDGVLGPLKKGGFHLARETGTAILPVALCGTRDVLPPETRRMNHDVPVRVVFGAPIETAGRPIPDLMAEVQSFLERELAAVAI